MKCMIISDIHGSFDDLKKVMDIYEEEKNGEVDYIRRYSLSWS